jgi:anti-sigma factor RsiW
MLNHEGSHHEHFEELCALAASGQISEPEFLELQDHLRQCAPCQSAYADFVDLLHSKLPLADPGLLGSAKLPSFFSKDSSYRDRFIARARKEGLSVSQRKTPERSGPWWLRLSYPQLAALAIVVLLMTAGYLGYSLH